MAHQLCQPVLGPGFRATARVVLLIAQLLIMQAVAARYRRRAARKGRTARKRAYYSRAVKSRSRAVRSARRSLANQRTGGFLGIEYKFLDCAWNAVVLNTSTDGSSGEMQPSSGCTNAISVPAQGDGESNRDGRKYCIKSIWVSGIIDSTALQDQADMTEMQGWFFALVRVRVTVLVGPGHAG